MYLSRCCTQYVGVFLNERVVVCVDVRVEMKEIMVLKNCMRKEHLEKV